MSLIGAFKHLFISPSHNVVLAQLSIHLNTTAVTNTHLILGTSMSLLLIKNNLDVFRRLPKQTINFITLIIKSGI